MTAPLKAFCILELGGFISGPFATQLLAEMGAQVIKIEPVDGGDAFRGVDGSDYSPQFRAYNAGKESVALNLKQPEGRAEFLRLVAQADAVVDNFRPGVMDKLGLTRESLEEARAGLVHCSITGFGAVGPYRDRPSYDSVAMAISGLMSQLLDPENPRIAGPAMADSITGFYAAIGVLSALLERESTGERRFRRIEISMIDALTSFNREPFARFFDSGEKQTPYKRAAASQSYVLACADGKQVALHLSSPQKFWDALRAAMDNPPELENARYRDKLDRIRYFKDIGADLARIFASRTRSKWLKALTENGVPHAPVYELDEVVEDDHAKATGQFVQLDHPTRGPVWLVAPPIIFDGTRGQHKSAPPDLGEHNRLRLKYE